MRSRLRRKGSRQRTKGVAALELAMSLAFLVPLLCGMLNFGYYFYVGTSAEGAARIGVRRAVRLNAGITCGNAANVALVQADGTAAPIGTGAACTGGVARCYMNEPPLNMGAATTVTLTCLAAPVDPTWKIDVDVDFPPAMNFLSSLFRTRAAGKIWYHATLTSD